MIGGRRRRVVAVIGRQDDQVVLSDTLQEFGDPGVQLPQSFMKPRHVVAVPPALVELDDVHENEPLGQPVERRFDEAVGIGVRGGVLAGDVATREQVVHLADPHTGNPPLRQEIEQRLPHRLDRKVAAVRRARVPAGAPLERPRDHPADRVLPGQDLAGDPAARVQLFERNRVLVNRDLEDRVRGRVHDPLPGLLVLRPQLGNDRRSRRGGIAQPAAPGALRELVEQRLREPLRIRAERPLQLHAADLPVSGCAVLPLRGRQGDAVRGGGIHLRRQAGHAATPPQPQSLEIGQLQAADRPGHVAEGVAPLVAVRRLVGSGADAEPVEDDDRGAPLHSYTRVKRLPSPVRNSRCSSPLHAAN